MSNSLEHLDHTQRHMLGLATQIMSWYGLTIADLQESVSQYETQYSQFPDYTQCDHSSISVAVDEEEEEETKYEFEDYGSHDEMLINSEFNDGPLEMVSEPLYSAPITIISGTPNGERRRSWGSYSDTPSDTPPSVIQPRSVSPVSNVRTPKPSTWICTRRDFRDKLISGTKICPKYSTCVDAACTNFHIEDQFICSHAASDNFCPESNCDKIVIKKCRNGRKCKDSTCSFRH